MAQPSWNRYERARESGITRLPFCTSKKSGVCKAVVGVIGNEGRGLSPAVQACITQRITIPSFGRAESLNAAVAAAIVCDNLRRLAGPT